MSGGGHNLVVIDPHMDLGSFCLSLLPERTLYISPPRPVEVGGVQKALAMPVIGSSRDPELQSSLLKDVIVSSQDGVWGGPRLQVIMRVLLSRFIQAGSTDLAAFAKTLLDRNALIRAVGGDTEEPLLAQFIREITQDWKSWREYSSSTLNRLIPIVSDRGGMLHIVSGRPGYDMGQMLWRGSVFVVDTSMIPRDTARVLAGLVLLSIFSHCASERPGRKTFVVVDEAHSVSQSVLETLLREGRKFNLHLILSTQFIRRDEPLYASVVNNCRTFVLFSLSGPEAAAVSGATGISGLEPVLSSMPSLTALLYSTAGPEPVGPVTFSTAPVHGANLAVDAIRRSVELYGTPRSPHLAVTGPAFMNTW
ncbi:ATP-binding protein [Thermogymnomonas acidicola]|uniref:ATP-binding protein n=1 Tax=Thermogymnomonas acidicola TaxID=399579 RepID=UPI001494E3CD|nr:ATP-binding protein [Thermogymnomonas acidicola]